MTETTSNHNWTIPTVGGDNDQWGQILNDFFDGELDEQVSLKGPYSERPSAANGNVKLYLATDRRIVYYNNGSSWEAVYGLGTDSNPVPGTSHFESLSAVDQYIDGRPWTTTGPLTIDVSNYATPQAAANQIPRCPKHEVTLDAGGGNDYSSTDLIIPPIFGQAFNANGEYPTFRILGGQPSYAIFNSVAFAGGTGVTIGVRGIEFTGETPYTNEPASLEFYNCDEALIRNSNFAGSTDICIECYRSELQISQENEITGQYDHFGNVKHSGRITVNKAVAGNGFDAISGNDLNQTVWDRGSGHIYHDPQSVAVGGTNGLADSADGSHGATVNKRTETVIEGEGPTLSFYLRDRFGDGKLLNRPTRISGHYIDGSELRTDARYRPEWTDSDSSVSASTGAATIPGGGSVDVIGTSSTHTYGTWELTTQFATTPTTDQTAIELVNDGFVRLELNQRPGAGDVRLISVNGAGTIGTATVSYDTSTHDWIVTRDANDNWSVKRDGSEIITGTDGSGGDSQQFRIRNKTDADLNVSRIDLY